MKRYSAYKDSGIEWLGKMPEHWKEIRLKYIGYLFGGLSGKSGSDFNNDENSNNKRFIPFTNIANNSKIDTTNLQLVHFRENETQNMVQRGDLFFLMSSENFDDVGKSAVLDQVLTDVYLNSFCRGLRITDEEIDPIYLNYLLSCNPLRSKLIIGANGFTRINLKTEKIKDLSVLVPSLPEQTQIATFLDHKTQLIDNLIEKKEKLVKLLKEERTAVINQAVTKGLDPNVPMKDSGIEWVGEIPAHWEVTRLKYIGYLYGGLSGKSGQDFNNEKNTNNKYYIPFTNIANNSKVDPTYLQLVHFEENENQNMAQKGDIFFLMSSENFDDVGKTAVLDYRLEDVYLNSFCRGMRITNKEIDANYLNYLLSCNPLRNKLIMAANGFTRINLKMDKIKDLPVFIFPLSEQIQIASFLDQKTKQMDDSIDKITKEIDLIKEYKTTLINEVVTGKIDVREYKLEESIEL